MSLRSANPDNTQFLFRQQGRPDVATDVLSAIEQIPQIDEFENTPYMLSAQQVIRGPVQTVGNDTNLQRSNAYSFIAAYLLKLLVKSDDNVVAGIINMKDRFVSFYGPSRTVSGFTLTRNQALAMKDALHSQSHIMSTFTHAIANTHQNFVDNYSNKEVQVVSYLGILPFSYTGLHSYNLMMKLKGITNVNLDTLLSMYNCNITAPALRKIAQIARDYERTETEPQRNVTFKYCTLWAPHYFEVLRSRQSAHLLYTIACTWKHLNLHDERADPENIAATRKLPADMKRALKRTGQRIGDSLKGRILSGARASNAYAIADNIAVEPEGGRGSCRKFFQHPLNTAYDLHHGNGEF